MKEHALPALPVLPVTKTNHAKEREGQSPDSSKKNGESLPPLLLIRRTQNAVNSKVYGVKNTESVLLQMGGVKVYGVKNTKSLLPQVGWV